MNLGKVFALSDCLAESKGQAICGEESDLKPLCAVLQPRVLSCAVNSTIVAGCRDAGTDLSYRAAQTLREPGGPGGVCR